MKIPNVLNRRNRVLLKELVKTDFKLRYNGSALGMLWSVLKPLLLFAIMYVVFVHFLRFGAGIPHFAVSLLLAVTLWSFFSEATSQGMKAIVDRGDLIRKINFPKYIIVVSATISALINLAISLAVVLVFALLNGVDFHWHILLAIPVLIELYVLALGLALLLSTIYVKFRDIGHIWDVVLQGAFYATPIIYPISMVATVSATGAKALLLNPMAQIIQDARYLVVYDGTDTIWTYLSNPFVQIIPIIIVLALIMLAAFYFRKNSKKFAEQI
jgi:ABC-2 type transport system permease protein